MIFTAFLQQLLFFFLHVETTGAFRKPLSAKEEQLCFQKLKAGDASAREALILHNMRLVAHIVKKYCPTQNEQEDLLSIGTVGLVKAVSSFDCEKGAKFATYASRCIENEILMHFRSRRKQGETVCMGDPIDTDKDGNPLTLMDIIEDGIDLQAQVDTRMQAQQLYQFLEQALSRRELEILVYRYGLYGTAPLTQREVAKKLRISRSYVSRLEKRAITILRNCYATEMDAPDTLD